MEDPPLHSLSSPWDDPATDPAEPTQSPAEPSALLEQPVRVGPSSIHGAGVFCRRPIAEGAWIGLYEGPLVDVDDTYVLWVEVEFNVWRGVDGRNDLRYLNHSSRPNAEFLGASLWALRSIAADEEITFHYGEDWEGIE